jgi:hypothetical protein
VQPFVQRVAEWTIKIAVEKKHRVAVIHNATLPKMHIPTSPTRTSPSAPQFCSL